MTSQMLREVLNKPYVIEFFIKYARFEYALKMAGFYKKVDSDSFFIKKVDLDRFLFEIDESKLSEALKPFYDYLMEHPVKKLKNDLRFHDGTFDNGMTNIRKFAENIVRIRNNLFHGNKFIEFLPGENRDEYLIKNAILVIEWMVDLKPEVRGYYGYSN